MQRNSDTNFYELGVTACMKRLLAFAISAALCGVVGAQVADPRNEWARSYNPDTTPLAAPRTTSHPIDSMVFLADYGVESAIETLREWEADPDMRDRLHQRVSYREYARVRAQGRLHDRIAQQAEEVQQAPAAVSPAQDATFWRVFLATSTRLEAEQAVSSFTEKGINDFYIVADGDQRNMVSLGLYGDITNARARKDAIRQLGFDAQLSAQPPANTVARSRTVAATSPSPRPTSVPASAPTPRPATDDIDAFSGELQRLRGQIRSITAERDELAGRLASLEDAHSLLLADHRALKAEHSDLQLAFGRLKDDNVRLVGEVEAWSERYAALQAEHDTLSDEHRVVLAMLEDIRNGADVDADALLASFEQGAEEQRRAAVRIQHQESDEARHLHAMGLAALDNDEAPVAVRWFLQAAAAGSANAMNSLGFLYENGWGAVRSPREAYLWYQRAAEAGHVHGMRNLARLYEGGSGVGRNEQEASYWMERARMVDLEVAMGRPQGPGEG